MNEPPKLPAPPLEGASLRLRYERLRRLHASELAECLTDLKVYEFIPGFNPLTEEHLLAEFRILEAGPPEGNTTQQWWNFIVRQQIGGQAIGRIQATIVGKRAEVAYVFGPSYWGQGFASEAVTWLLERLLKDALVSMTWATVTPHNGRSIRLLRRLGYEQIAEGWPALASYDPGDWVFRKALSAGQEKVDPSDRSRFSN